jgi:hypothetical protein
MPSLLKAVLEVLGEETTSVRAIKNRQEQR